MVKRARLTLDHAQESSEDEVKVADKKPPRKQAKRRTDKPVTKQADVKQGRNLGRAVLVAGLTIASIVIFKRKIF